MANAKKCDRCGKYYTPDIESGTLRLVSDSNIWLEEHVDLCNRCIKDFVSFKDDFRDVPGVVVKNYEVVVDDINYLTELAEIFVNAVNAYGVFTVTDFYDFIGKTPNYSDRNIGWTDIRGINITLLDPNKWRIEMPEINWRSKYAQN